MTDRADALHMFLERIPFVQTLGMVCDIKGNEMTAILPFQDKLIGFLELCAMSQVFLNTELERPPRPINLTIDYLRSAKAEDLYARAYIPKLGRRIANVRCEAWQADRAKPVATLHAHFLVTPPDTQT